MKKTLATLLAVSMLLTACGGGNAQSAETESLKGDSAWTSAEGSASHSGQKVTMKVSVGVSDNHFEAVAVEKMKDVH